MEDRVKVILYKDKAIVYGDYSGLVGDEIVALIEQQELESLKLQNKKILHLLNFTDSKMNNSSKERAKEMVATLTSKNYTVKTAAFGVSGLQRLIANAVKGDIYFGKDIDDSKEWLIKE
jgi:hypothetical protein